MPEVSDLRPLNTTSLLLLLLLLLLVIKGAADDAAGGEVDSGDTTLPASGSMGALTSSASLTGACRADIDVVNHRMEHNDAATRR